MVSSITKPRTNQSDVKLIIVRFAYYYWRQKFLKYYLPAHSFVLRSPFYVIVRLLSSFSHCGFLNAYITVWPVIWWKDILVSRALQSLVVSYSVLLLISLFKLYACLLSIFSPTHFLRTNGVRLCAKSNNLLCYVITDKGNMYIPCSPLLDPRNIARKCNSLI
jgi:hypothetical protein